jgi:hypothetical protein
MRIIANRSMNARHTTIHSLIVKIWRKDDASTIAQPTWHGQVTHVPSGERAYAQNPNELLTIVAVQLRKLGVRLATCWRLRLWWHERKHRLNGKTS